MSPGSSAQSRSVVIIGAGPYGLAAAAHLRAREIDVHLFGRVMSFWREHMPKGMFLRSGWDASHIGEPRSSLDLAAFEVASGRILARPVPLADFIAYGDWFHRSSRGQIDERDVPSLEPEANGFRLTIADGNEPVEPVRGAPGVRWMCLVTEVPIAFNEIRRGKLPIGTYLRSLRPPIEAATFASDDPVPGLLELPLVLQLLLERRGL